jgi:hypothetical protein
MSESSLATREPTNHEIWIELETGRHGGFAKALANAWFLADENNRNKIEYTWPHLVAKARYFLITEPI